MLVGVLNGKGGEVDGVQAKLIIRQEIMYRYLTFTTYLHMISMISMICLIKAIIHMIENCAYPNLNSHFYVLYVHIPNIYICIFTLGYLFISFPPPKKNKNKKTSKNKLLSFTAPEISYTSPTKSDDQTRKVRD